MYIAKSQISAIHVYGITSNVHIMLLKFLITFSDYYLLEPASSYICAECSIRDY